MKLLDIYSRLRKDIQYIERQLEQSVQSEHDVLQEASLHLLKAGGKRIRPVFVLLAAQFGQYSLASISPVAVSLELIHMASLVHDDVIDHSDTRRGEQTVRAKWDNRVAMYTGDFIFAKALSEITEINKVAVHKILAKGFTEMCIGEIEQIRYFFKTGQTVRDYLLRIRRKTAYLIAISCQLGALAADVSYKDSQRLYSFGYNAGMAFQIRDDILDLIGTEQQIGKPPGSDVRQGNITLPVILALREEKLRPTVLEEIERIQEQPEEADTAPLIELIRQSEGLQQAESYIERYIDKAIAALEPLDSIKAKKDFIEIAHFIGNRSY